DDLFALGEWAVLDGDLAASEPNSRTVLAGKQTARIDERAVLHGLLDELVDRFHQRGRRLGLAVPLPMADVGQVFQGFSLLRCWVRTTCVARFVSAAAPKSSGWSRSRSGPEPGGTTAAF